MSLRLVDPVYLKIEKTPKVKYPKVKYPKIDYNIIIKVVVFCGIVYGLYILWNYIQTTEIKNPDLSCLPPNIRNNSFFRNLEKTNTKPQLQPKNHSKPYASNEDELLINLRNF